MVTVAVTVTEAMLGEGFATAATVVTGTFLVTVTVAGRGLFGTVPVWKIILLVIFSACGEVMRRGGTVVFGLDGEVVTIWPGLLGSVSLMTGP